MNQNTKIEVLISKGVKIPDYTNIYIGPEVDINNISSDGVTIYSGCRILGNSTTISSGVILGSEGPVSLKNCRLGCNVELKGGSFNKSIFMDGVIVGPECSIRAGTILEEFVSIGHSVGLKQTIIFPFVKLGSLINFCDCFMSGGTSKTNHSEVGSSYVHFNYTPNQDKATSSLIGDVAYGVMLNQKPIFLGGQGGLVGPCRIAYGTVIASGSIQRKDQFEPDRLIVSKSIHKGSMKYVHGVYLSIDRHALNNILYIANLLALMCWYKNIRRLFVVSDFNLLIFKGLLEILEIVIKSRIDKFEEFCFKLKKSSDLYKNLLKKNASNLLIKKKKELYNNRKIMSNMMHILLNKTSSDLWANNKLVSHITQQIDQHDYSYLELIQSLDPKIANLGTLWLEEITNEITNKILSLFPSLKK